MHESADFDEKAADLDDEQLRKAAKLLELEDLAESADIPQFLAIAREAAERATDLRPFDVQLLGALRMLAGDVVEMATGEGKTLVGRDRRGRVRASAAAACTSSPSTTTWPAATPNGWARCSRRWA